ncbi:hypothetical protein GGI25_004922 [Coemansia spiralis]|uniref:Tetratricopeptide SHNi-TPR domain-containing protein n=2 Tax=Coemansia TaxID=4863 RepID=A0A9W8G4Q4_9FUNG|nr:hypothetical protein BX070DRAFT_236840 [Coemansia spiralis]KAJ1988641.1 hypothetical protein EDC05_005189 [Coemansia umbellata]KAJ2622425.1 hypothetical protein GGI26_003288 [Coemansia sp. RSA 1358]KAJ2672879.1 hypothetical protein GGI25_004922 [Coemansia spiralis]
MSDKGKQPDISTDEGSADYQNSAYNAVMPVIEDLLKRGTRAFALENWEEAIDNFGELSSITEQTFGSESPRYAECLVMYGRALLQHAVEQSALLAQKTLAEAASGNLQTGEQNGESKDNEDKAEVRKANINFEGEPDFRQIESLEHENGEAGSSKGKEADTSEQEDEEHGEEDEEEEHEDDFAAAWDVLDLARVIQSKATDSKSQLKYAETLMLLGDVSMESENFPQAVKDFTAALEVKQQYLGDDNRELAELYYKVALAHEYNRNTEKALELMAEVQRILGNRLKKLESSTTTKDVEESETLKDVLEDVASKIEEWKAPQKPIDLSVLSSEESILAEKAKAMFKQALESGNINDITGLIKSKKGKKPADELEAENAKRKPATEPSDDDAKRVKSD